MYMHLNVINTWIIPVPLSLPPQGRGDTDEEDRFPALLLQRLILLFRHLGHCVGGRAARPR